MPLAIVVLGVTAMLLATLASAKVPAYGPVEFALTLPVSAVNTPLKVCVPVTFTTAAVVVSYTLF